MVRTKIIADSISPAGNRITTMLVTMHRFILAELNTHRVFSRNSASSRAIPTSRFRSIVKTEPAIPVFFGANKPGMQATEEVTDVEAHRAMWLDAIDAAAEWHAKAEQLGLHKQLNNRPLEFALFTQVLITATDWLNFFALRCHSAAQPEMQAAADTMLHAYVNSEPDSLSVGEWHMPFYTDQMEELTHEDKIKVCVARAARTSYYNFDGKVNFVEDLRLHDSLLASGHLSPFEHVAMCLGSSARSGNFIGWEQYRQTFRNQSRTVDLKALLAERKKISKFATDDYARSAAEYGVAR